MTPEKIKNKRLQLGLERIDVAHAVKVSVSTIGNLEAGKNVFHSTYMEVEAFLKSEEERQKQIKFFEITEDPEIKMQPTNMDPTHTSYSPVIEITRNGIQVEMRPDPDGMFIRAANVQDKS